MSIIGIAGLPGSGKTTFGEKLVAHYCGILMDDCRQAVWTTTDPGGLVRERLSDYHRNLRNFSGSTLVFTDPEFCYEAGRKWLNSIVEEPVFKNGSQRVWWICFENDLEQCIQNQIGRAPDRAISSKQIRAMSKNYTIPDDATVVKVWRPGGHGGKNG